MKHKIISYLENTSRDFNVPELDENHKINYLDQWKTNKILQREFQSGPVFICLLICDQCETEELGTNTHIHIVSLIYTNITITLLSSFPNLSPKLPADPFLFLSERKSSPVLTWTTCLSRSKPASVIQQLRDKTTSERVGEHIPEHCADLKNWTLFHFPPFDLDVWTVITDQISNYILHHKLCDI